MARVRDSIRAVDVYESGAHQSSQNAQTHVEITDYGEESVTVRDTESGEYPYDDQTVARGRFEYSKDGVLGRSTGKGSFQLRLGSRIFVVRIQSGSAPRDVIVEALAQELAEQRGGVIEVHNDLPDASDSMWGVLDRAGWVGKVVIRFRGERKPVSELREETGVDLDALNSEYPLLGADFILETPWGEPVNVTYDDGRVGIHTDSDATYEYVLQLLETSQAE